MGKLLQNEGFQLEPVTLGERIYSISDFNSKPNSMTDSREIRTVAFFGKDRDKWREEIPNTKAFRDELAMIKAIQEKEVAKAAEERKVLIDQMVLRFQGLFTADQIAGVKPWQLDELTQPACLDALRKGLFTLDDAINMLSSHYSITMKELLMPEFLEALQITKIRLDQISGMSWTILQALRDPRCQEALIKKTLTLTELKQLKMLQVVDCVMKPHCQKALADHVVSMEQIIDIQQKKGYLFLQEILGEACLDALRENRVKMDDLLKMNTAELRVAAEIGSYAMGGGRPSV